MALFSMEKANKFSEELEKESLTNDFGEFLLKLTENLTFGGLEKIVPSLLSEEAVNIMHLFYLMFSNPGNYHELVANVLDFKKTGEEKPKDENVKYDILYNRGEKYLMDIVKYEKRVEEIEEEEIEEKGSAGPEAESSKSSAYPKEKLVKIVLPKISKKMQIKNIVNLLIVLLDDTVYVSYEDKKEDEEYSNSEFVKYWNDDFLDFTGYGIQIIRLFEAIYYMQRQENFINYSTLRTMFEIADFMEIGKLFGNNQKVLEIFDEKISPELEVSEKKNILTTNIKISFKFQTAMFIELILHAAKNRLFEIENEFKTEFFHTFSGLMQKIFQKNILILHKPSENVQIFEYQMKSAFSQSNVQGELKVEKSEYSDIAQLKNKLKGKFSWVVLFENDSLVKQLDKNEKENLIIAEQDESFDFEFNSEKQILKLNTNNLKNENKATWVHLMSFLLAKNRSKKIENTWKLLLKG